MNRQRIIYYIVFVACISLLSFGLYLQHSVGLEPCPLCILQRIAYISVAIVSLIAAIHDPQGLIARLYNSLFFIVSVLGLAIAGRQTWLQHLPEEKIPQCGPGLDYMLDTFPLFDALHMVLSGSGECAEVKWHFIDLSIAEWSLLCFLLLLVLSVIMFFWHKRLKL